MAEWRAGRHAYDVQSEVEISQHMNKRKLYTSIVAGCAVVLLGLLIIYLHERPPLLYYANIVHWQELPARLIRPAFRYVVERDLPPRADGLRSIFLGGRDPTIFVRFKTDSDGMAYILETFERNGIWETFDDDRLQFMNANDVGVFPTLPLIQKRAGVILFDQHSVESGRMLSGSFDPQKGPSYGVFIDDRDSTLYIAAGNM